MADSGAGRHSWSTEGLYIFREFPQDRVTVEGVWPDKLQIVPELIATSDIMTTTVTIRPHEGPSATYVLIGWDMRLGCFIGQLLRSDEDDHRSSGRAEEEAPHGGPS